MIRDISVNFKFFLTTFVRAKRTKLFFLLSFLPALIFLIIRIVALLNPGSRIFSASMLTRIGLSFYYQLFIQILALFYGASVINDEIENRTLIYLTTSPVSKASIIIGKFLAQLMVISVIVTLSMAVAFIIPNFTNMFKATYVKELLLFTAVGVLSLAAYSSLFNLLSTLLKKTVIFGILFIFGWESFVQYFPGTTQKLTIIHYIKSLLPSGVFKEGGFLTFRLQPSSPAESLVTLIVLTLVCLTVSILIFSKKEYLLSDQN